jgi:hypothetical protein
LIVIIDGLTTRRNLEANELQIRFEGLETRRIRIDDFARRPCVGGINFSGSIETDNEDTSRRRFIFEDDLHMKAHGFRTAARAGGLMLAALVLMSDGVRADLQYGVTYPSGPVVTISFTPSNGHTLLESTMVVPFTVTPEDNQGHATGPSFIGFCIDLWHNMYSPSTFTSNGQLTSGFQAVDPAGVTPYVSDPQLTYQLTYLGTIVNAPGVEADANAMGAIQLAIWHLIDGHFSYNYGTNGDSTLDRDYAAITGYNGSTYSGGLLGGTAPAAGFGSGIAAYHSNQSYTGGKVILVDRAGNEAQNVITWVRASASRASRAPRSPRASHSRRSARWPSSAARCVDGAGHEGDYRRRHRHPAAPPAAWASRHSSNRGTS